MQPIITSKTMCSTITASRERNLGGHLRIDDSPAMMNAALEIGPSQRSWEFILEPEEQENENATPPENESGS